MQEKTPQQLYRIALQRGLQIVPAPSNTVFKWYDPRHIYSRSYDAKGCPRRTCPTCRKKLKKSETTIPIGNNRGVRFFGRRCMGCDKLYVADAEDVLAVLQNNPFAKDYTFNGNRYDSNFTGPARKPHFPAGRRERREDRAAPWNAARGRPLTDLQKKLFAVLRGVPDAVMMICVEWDGPAAESKEEQYIIVSRAHPELPGHVLLYSTALARELLTAATYPLRQDTGDFNGRTYRVTDVLAAQTEGIGAPEAIMPRTLFIKADGGYASSVKNRNYEIVDLLLYAPATQRYEIIKATYNRIEGICYSDIWLYRTFARKFGRPDLKPEFIKSDNGFGVWNELSQESVLMCYGYSVAAANGLSSIQRRELLMEIVDFEILSVAEIVRLLSFFIESHPADKDAIARFKWQDDLNFIKDYKANPERFLIANDVRRK